MSPCWLIAQSVGAVAIPTAEHDSDDATAMGVGSGHKQRIGAGRVPSDRPGRNAVATAAAC